MLLNISGNRVSTALSLGHNKKVKERKRERKQRGSKAREAATEERGRSAPASARDIWRGGASNGAARRSSSP